MELAWYCPSEGDGHRLGTREPERAPDFAYLARVARAAEAAGVREILIPTGAVNDSFDPGSAFAESWTTAAGLAAVTRRIGLIVAVGPRRVDPALLAHQAETLERMSGGRIAINLTAGGGPDDGYGGPGVPHDERYALLSEVADSLRSRFRGPLYLGGASPAALDLAARVADAYLVWGEPHAQVARRADDIRALAQRPMRIGLRLHVIARRGDGEAVEVARGLLSDAQVRGDRAEEYAGFDSVGQARMNAIRADDEGWVEPGLWAGIREVRGGAGTALVGSYRHVAAALDRYRDAGVDFLIASGYPHLEEVRRVARRVWPRLSAATPA